MRCFDDLNSFLRVGICLGVACMAPLAAGEIHYWDFEDIPENTDLHLYTSGTGLDLYAHVTRTGYVVSENGGDKGDGANFGNSPTHVVWIHGPMSLRFVHPLVSDHGIVGATYVSMIMGDGDPDPENWKVSFYGINGELLDSREYYGDVNDGVFIEGSAADFGQLIGSVKLGYVQGKLTYNDVFFDDLTYDLYYVPCDLNMDRIVDANDLQIMAEHWLDDYGGYWEGNLIAQPGHWRVDIRDFALLAEQWGQGHHWRQPDVSDEMVFVPGGAFDMGDSFGEGFVDELPVHQVYISPFYMGRHEITNQQFCDFLNAAYAEGRVEIVEGAVRSRISGDPICDLEASIPFDVPSDLAFTNGTFSPSVGRDDHPAVYVSWHGAAFYCNWRSREEGYQECYDLYGIYCDFAADGYRLPTEAEWEYAARGGLNGAKYPWGDSIDGSLANYQGSGDPAEGTWPTTAETLPVGQYSANGYGLFDMAGNVSEFCNEAYVADYYGMSPSSNPTGIVQAGLPRVSRGGDWAGGASALRCAFRASMDQTARNAVMGFRIARRCSTSK